jgi:hypothetical protein
VFPYVRGRGVVQIGRVFKKRIDAKPSVKPGQEAFSLALPINPLTLSRGASKMIKLVTKHTTHR